MAHSKYVYEQFRQLRQRATDFTLGVDRQFFLSLSLSSSILTRISGCRAGFGIVLVSICSTEADRLTHQAIRIQRPAQVAIRFVSFSLGITVALQPPAPYLSRARNTAFYSYPISAQRYSDLAKPFALHIIIFFVIEAVVNE